MKLRDLLKPSAILGDLVSTEKEGVIRELSLSLNRLHPNLSHEDIAKVLFDREKLGSTGVGHGVAIPHGKIKTLDNLIGLFARSRRGVDFKSHDHRPAHLFFVLLAPENVGSQHLQALSRLSRLLKPDEFRKQLLESRPEQLFDLLVSEDDKL